MKKELIWLVVFSLVIITGSAQDTLVLKLPDAIAAAQKSNPEILLASLDEEKASAKFSQTNAVFLPQVNLSYTAMVTNNPLNAFGFKLQQQAITAADFNPQLLNNPSATQNYMTKAEFNQPLVNVDMIYQRKAAGQQVDMYSYKTKRTKEYVALEVQKAYAMLQLSYQAVVVLTEARHTVNSIFEATKNRFEKGFLQKSDVLAVQVQVSTIESQLAEAKSNVRNSSDYLSILMGSKDKPLYKVEPLTKVEQEGKVENQVPENRADFKAMRAALAAQSMMIHSGKMSYLPKLNAFGNYMFNDKQAFGFGSNAYLVGAQFSWNLFSGTSQHFKITEQKIEHSRIELQLNYQKEQSQLELNKVLRQLQDTEFAIQQQEQSVSQASEALRIVQNRFELGLVSTNDVLQSQTMLSEQKLRQTETQFKYQTTLAYLQFLTSTSEQ
jgi:outer membrane protein TolC